VLKNDRLRSSDRAVKDGLSVDRMTLVEGVVAAKLPGAKVVAGSLYGSDDDHLEVLVVSDRFEGQPLVRQHQMVLNSLRDVLAEELHAIQLKTMTWEKYRQTYNEAVQEGD
jgi:stress-induced morphogen